MASAPKLKIGLILDTSLDPTDGVQQYVIHVGEWLRKQGHDVHYLVGETRRQDLFNVHSLSRNIGVRFNGNRTTIPLPTSHRKLRRFLRAEQFDILHVQMPHSPFMAQPLIMAAGNRTAVVGTFHIVPYGKLAAIGNRALGIWLRPSIKRLDVMLSVSTAAAEFARSSFIIQSIVLPNVIDFNLYHTATPAEHSKQGLNILFLGRLVERKGCYTLLKAVALLAKQPNLPRFHVTICGKGHLETQLKQFVEKEGLANIVNFVGFVSESVKPSYYAGADIAVFPSNGGESFGIVLLEAMCSGQAVVLAGNNPGYKSVMESHSELLFPPKDVAALANKISFYLTENTKREQAAKWGETLAYQFDINLIGPKLLDVYTKALHKRLSQ